MHLSRLNRFTRLKIRKLLTAGLFCLPVICHAAEKHDMRNSKYCEIILSQMKLTAAVYSTLGLSDCPEAIWRNITPAGIRKETGSFFAHLNGPRYWTIDGSITSPLVSKNQRVLGGLPMHESGFLHLSLMDMARGSAPYREHKVNRQTTWIYNEGRPVYELIDPNGQVFVMQSYSIEKSPLSAASLADLGTQLKLPNGWHFRTGVLKESAYLTAINNTAVVIQDALLNTYQLATRDLLKVK